MMIKAVCPGLVSGFCSLSPHLIRKTVVLSRYYFPSHFSHKESEAKEVSYLQATQTASQRMGSGLASLGPPFSLTPGCTVTMTVVIMEVSFVTQWLKQSPYTLRDSRLKRWRDPCLKINMGGKAVYFVCSLLCWCLF